MTIGGNIKNLLLEKGKTQADLARYLSEKTGHNVNRQTVNKWIPNGNENKTIHKPRSLYLHFIAEFLDVSVEQIITGEELEVWKTLERIQRYCFKRTECENCMFNVPFLDDDTDICAFVHPPVWWALPEEK